MMENPRPKKENIIKDIRNIFILIKELSLTAVKDIRNLFRLEKQTKAIKYRIFRDIKNLFEHEEDHYKRVGVSNFWSDKSNGNSNMTLSVEEYPNKISPYLKDIIKNLKYLTLGKFN